MTLTRTGLAALAVVSVFATAVVLAGSAGSAPSRMQLIASVQHVVAARAAMAAAAKVTPSAPTPAATADTPGGAPVPSPAPATATPALQAAAQAASTTGSDTTSPKDTTTRPPAPTPAPTPKPKPSRVGHIFVIALTGAGYQETFGAQSPMPYLATELRPRGALLSGFHPLDAADLPNYLAFAGGLEPNAQTRAECANYSDGTCVQPNTVLSLGDQVTSSGRLWRAYSEDMGAQPCRHPPNGTTDDTLQGRPGDAYATRHNPFVYFHSLLDLGDCQANDLALDALPADLKTEKTTPNLVFIAPNLCNSGTESPCADGTAGGPPAADAFLKARVPQILHSPAYEHDGALVIAFLSGTTGTAPTGALVLSRFARRAALYAQPYDPDALLRSIEDLFALNPLENAKRAKSFAKLTLTTAFPPS